MIDSRDLKELSEEEREYLSKQFDLHKKSAVKYAFFCVFLGFVGGHQYYLGKTVPGVLFTLFSWTLLPFLVSIVQLFSQKKRLAISTKTLSKISS